MTPAASHSKQMMEASKLMMRAGCMPLQQHGPTVCCSFVEEEMQRGCPLGMHLGWPGIGTADGSGLLHQVSLPPSSSLPVFPPTTWQKVPHQYIVIAVFTLLARGNNKVTRCGGGMTVRPGETQQGGEAWISIHSFHLPSWQERGLVILP